MKRFIFFAHVYTCFAVTYPAAIYAQDSETSFPNYVVIGAFAFQENAVHFTNEAKRRKFPAKFELNPNRNLYYVYVLSTTDREHAVAEALKLRGGTKYFDTWVYSGALGNTYDGSLSRGTGQDLDPVTGKTIGQIQNEQHQSTPSALPRMARRSQTQSEQAYRSSGTRSSNGEVLPDEVSDDPSWQANLSNNDSKRDGSAVKKGNQPTTTSNQNVHEDSSVEELETRTKDQSTASDALETPLQTSKSTTNPVKKSTSSQKTGEGYVVQSEKNQSQSLDGSQAQYTTNQQSTVVQQSGSKKAVVQGSRQSQPQGSDGQNAPEPTEQQNNVAYNSAQNAANQLSQQTRGQKSDGHHAQQTTSQQNTVSQQSGNNGLVQSGQTQRQSGSVQDQQQAANQKSTPAQNQNQKQTALSGNTPGQKQQTSISQTQSARQAQQVNGVPVTGQNVDQTVTDQQNEPLSDKSTTESNVKSPASKNQTTTQNATTKGGAEKKAVAVTNTKSGQSGDNSKEEVTAPITPPIRQTTAPLTSEEVTGKNFYFHLYRADNLNMIPGEVEAIDFEKSRKMATYAANEGVKVIMPSGKTKRISFVCQVFGYRKQQQEFDPSSPSEELYLDENGNLVVPFELVRLQKGDIAIMYNVFFFKDAAVMRPESRYEVNNLLDLLQENPSYKIKIHGHTNGNASGKIIRMDNSGNFYSLNDTKQAFGSAKELSEERALVIRRFLVSSGISADRMEVKAWGGKKPIHDKHSARAHENVRVEIEILSQ